MQLSTLTRGVTLIPISQKIILTICRSCNRQAVWLQKAFSIRHYWTIAFSLVQQSLKLNQSLCKTSQTQDVIQK
uniref:Uncharacterized protein n=1 Tax=Octopus bimaculoides TaxID=37653 RepID=A0A0L8HC91_OCTBM